MTRIIKNFSALPDYHSMDYVGISEWGVDVWAHYFVEDIYPRAQIE